MQRVVVLCDVGTSPINTDGTQGRRWAWGVREDSWSGVLSMTNLFVTCRALLTCVCHTGTCVVGLELKECDLNCMNYVLPKRLTFVNYS